jgi:hypothetical protein
MNDASPGFLSALPPPRPSPRRAPPLGLGCEDFRQEIALAMPSPGWLTGVKTFG